MASTCLAQNQAQAPVDIDFGLRLHTKLNELLLGMRDEIQVNGIPGESQLAELLEKRSDEVLRSLVSEITTTPAKKTLGQRIAGILNHSIKWKAIAQKILASTYFFENNAAQKGLVAFSVLFVHLAAGWVLPPVFLAMGCPELILAVWAYPLIGQGAILSVLLKNISDQIRLRKLYGARTLEQLREIQKNNRHQLALAEKDDVLIPLLRKWGRYEVAVSNPGILGRILNLLRVQYSRLSWKKIETAFSNQDPENDKIKIWIDILNAHKKLSMNEKSSFLLAKLSRDFPEKLETLLKTHRSQLSRSEVSDQLFFRLENWAGDLQKISSPEDAFAILKQAPTEAPSAVIWNLWKEFGIPVFLKNNLSMDLIERRSWVAVSETMLAARSAQSPLKWSLSEISDFQSRLRAEHPHQARKLSNRIYNRCFTSLIKRFSQSCQTCQSPAL